MTIGGPRVSIIIPTFNRLIMLTNAIESVRRQRWPDIELIVIDGGSTDGTQSWLDQCPDVVFVTGKDEGVYDAMNKGLALATGHILAFLNSDDVLECDAIAYAWDVFTHNPNCASVAGIAVISKHGVADEQVDGIGELLLSPEDLFLGRCTPNSRFFRRDAAIANGPFNLDYKFVSDRDWLARFASANHVTVHMNRVVYRYLSHEGSMTFDPRRKLLGPIRRDRLNLAKEWRSRVGAPLSFRKAAAKLEIKMRLAVSHQAALAGDFSEAATTFLDTAAWRAIVGVVFR